MNIKTEPKTILIAPLNWGLGHATRCIPIIRALQEQLYSYNCIRWNCTCITTKRVPRGSNTRTSILPC
jgi:hypothetical protein